MRSHALAVAATLVACGGAIDATETSGSQTNRSSAEGGASPPTTSPVDSSTPDGGAFGAPASDASPPAAPDAGGIDPWITVQTTSGCVAWSKLTPEPFIPYPADPLAVPADALIESTALHLNASWVGHAVAPSGWVPPAWDLTLDFTDDGQNGGLYSASASGAASPFYYGTTSAACASLRTWQLLDVGADGVEGKLGIPYAYGPSTCGLPSWQGELRGVAADATGYRVQLTFVTSDGYGPIRYDLFRRCTTMR